MIVFAIFVLYFSFDFDKKENVQYLSIYNNLLIPHLFVYIILLLYICQFCVSVINNYFLLVLKNTKKVDYLFYNLL